MLNLKVELHSATSSSFLSLQSFNPSFSYFYYKSNKNKLRKQVILQTYISSLDHCPKLQTTYSHQDSIQLTRRQLRFSTSNTECIGSFLTKTRLSQSMVTAFFQLLRPNTLESVWLPFSEPSSHS